MCAFLSPKVQISPSPLVPVISSADVCHLLLENAVVLSLAVTEPDGRPAVLPQVANGGSEKPEVCQSHMV